MMCIVLLSSVCAFASTPQVSDSLDDPTFVEGDSLTDLDEALDEYDKLFDMDKNLTAGDVSNAILKIKMDDKLSAEQEEVFLEKLQIIYEDSGIQKASFPSSKYLAMVNYKQENGYYCGPATCKQTIKYINGSAKSQSAIAKSIGTTSAGSALPNMKNYVNKTTGKGYAIVTNPSKAKVKP